MPNIKSSFAIKALLLLALVLTSLTINAQSYFIVFPSKHVAATGSEPQEPVFPSIKDQIDQVYGSTSSLAVTMPTTVEAGDLLLIQAANHVSETFNSPSGWTKLFEASGNTQKSAIFARKADGSEGGSQVIIPLGGTSVSAITRSFRIVDWSGDMAGVLVYSDSFSGTSPTPPLC